MGAILVSEPAFEQHAELFTRELPGEQWVVVRGDRVEGDLEQVEIAFFSWDMLRAGAPQFARASIASRNLRWLHSFSAGVDNIYFQKFLENGVRVTTSSGAHAIPIAQTVMLYLLALSRDLPDWLEAQACHEWRNRDIVDLQGSSLGVVGMGPIGQEVARLGQAFRMRVLGFRRTPRGDEPCETLPLSELDAHLPEIDHLLLALPLKHETHGLVDAAFLARMQRGARLVNIGRGELIDEEALVEALRSGQLGGAGLDVFSEEPLPAESPLWDLPNVIITPHSSGANPGNGVRAAEIFADNVKRYRTGRPLRNEQTGPSYAPDSSRRPPSPDLTKNA